MNPVAEAHRTTTASDGVLLQEAAAGGGASYAALYDRYAEQVYNYCLRLTGSREDAADATQDAFVNVLGRLHKDDNPVLDFSSYLFAAARNESYALMRRRSRTLLSDEPPERAAYEADVETDPERAVLLHDSQEAVRVANGKLPPRHREVLALREVGGRSYEEIGQIMGISENAAAQLIWRARAKFKGALTAGAVASMVAMTEDCETAQVLINRLHDGESITDAEQEWLDEHLDECPKCRAARGMIFEVAASYRMWAPVALIATMKADMLAAAGSVVGADWTSPTIVGGSSGGGGGAGGGAANGAHANGAAVGRLAKRPRGAQAAAGAAVTAGVFAAIGLTVLGLGDNDSPVKQSAPPGNVTEPAQKSSSPKLSAAAADKSLTAQSIHSTPRVIPASPQVAAIEGTKATPKQDAPRGNAPGGDRRGGSPRSETPDQPGNGPGITPPENRQPGAPSPPGDTPGTQPDKPNPPPTNEPPGTPGSDPGGGGPGGSDPGGTEPPPITGGDCTWPGQGGGPGGCPPGHGGVPPGQGGTPPGQQRP